MKRVTFILTQSLECPSGVGRYWPLAKGLVKRGFKPRILALHPDYDKLAQRRFTLEGVDVWYVGQMHVQKTGSEKVYFGPLALLGISALATLRLTWAALTDRSDLVHLGKPHPMNGIAGLVLRALGCPVYLDCDDIEATSNRFGGRWQRKVVACFEDNLPRWVCGVTVNTSYLLARVRNIVPEDHRTILVPNAADSARFQMPEESLVAQIQQRYQLADRPVVAYIGSMSLTNHPIDLLLESFAGVVLKELPQATLLLIGGGEDLHSLQKMTVTLGIQKRVQFVGRVRAEDVPAYYAAVDVVVDPVYDDDIARARSPLKLYESLAVGTPIVTGDVGDRRQALEGQEELLVPPGDAEALGQRLVSLLQDGASRQRLRNWAGERRERFFWESRIDEFVRIYDAT